MYKVCLILNYKKTNNPILKCVNDHLTKKDMHTAHKQIKRFSTSFVIREFQIKTAIRYS